jgi:hypothetical protein
LTVLDRPNRRTEIAGSSIGAICEFCTRILRRSRCIWVNRQIAALGVTDINYEINALNINI